MRLCPAFGRLSVACWVVLPLLYSGGCAGVAGLLEAITPGHPAAITPAFQVTLCTPALLGFASAVTLLAGSHVRWSVHWQRRWLRFGYPLALLVAAPPLGGLRLPLLSVLAIGALAGTLLAVMLARCHHGPTDCSRV